MSIFTRFFRHKTHPSSRSRKTYPSAPNARWPFKLPDYLSEVEIRQIQRKAQRLAQKAPFGWGHTIDFGPFSLEGLLKDSYLQIAGFLDDWVWWPASMEQMVVADVGCFTGGLSLLMASRGANKVYAIDEIPENLAQCSFTARVFEAEAVECMECSVYALGERIPPASLDLILLSGVIYHLSDMLVGLVAMQTLLKPEGILLIESNAVECFQHSYANFGRFFMGMWWQPTALCIQDMCEFAGLSRPEVRFYTPVRCLARAIKPKNSRLLFKRGMNWPFSDLQDEVPRTLDPSVMAPAPCDHE